MTMPATATTRARRERGAILIELLVGVVILAILAVGAIAVTSKSGRHEVANQARNRLTATGESVLERIRTEGDWMRTDRCVNAPESGCSLDYLFDGTGTGIYAKPDPSLQDDDFGKTIVKVTAVGSKDGLGTSEVETDIPDSYSVRIELSYEDAARIDPNLKPVIVESTLAVNASVETGALTVQVCRLRGQADERIAYGNCDTTHSVRMKPGHGFGAPSPSDLDDANQPYICANPELARSPHPTRRDTPAYCFTGQGPTYTDDASIYSDVGDFWGNPVYDVVPNGKPLASVFTGPVGTPSPEMADLKPMPADEWRFVSVWVEPLESRTVTLTGVAGTPSAGTTVQGTTDAQGRVHFQQLTPGRYNATVPGAGTGFQLSKSLSVPGSSVTVDQGIESKATLFFMPSATHDFAISLMTTDYSYPWNPNRPDDIVPARKVPQKERWNPAWGTWTPDKGPISTYTIKGNTGRNPNDPTTRSSLCIELFAVPVGRLAQGSQTRCMLDDEVDRIAQRGPNGADTIRFSGLEPGLYGFKVLSWNAYLWGRENYPGFVWIDENGSTLPPTGNHVKQARIDGVMCSPGRRDAARAFDPTLGEGKTCYGSAMDIGTGGPGGTGNG